MLAKLKRKLSRLLFNGQVNLILLKYENELINKTKIMKKKILTLVLLIVVTLGYSNSLIEQNGTEVAIKTEATYAYSENEMHELQKANDSHLVVMVNVSNEDIAGKCILEGKLTIQTEQGDSVMIEFKISADTCKEAIRVQSQLLAVFNTK